MKLRVLWPGKTKKNYYRLAIEDYSSRIAKLVSFEIIETKEESLTDKQKSKRLKKESQHLHRKRTAPVCVLMNSSGIAMSSEQFSQWLQKQQTDVDFIVGGPQGQNLPEQSIQMSLGKMTMAHELARVVLLEQIYRAVTIWKRIPYHK